MNPQPGNEGVLLQALRQELVVKLQEDWENRWKPLGHGETYAGLGALPNQARFITQLFEHVYETLTQRFGSRAAANDFMVDHERTLARFLNDGYDKGFSAKTRNTIACYVGYQHYADFVRQYRAVHDPPPEVTEVTVVSLLPVPLRRQVLRLPPGGTIPLPTRRNRRRWALGGLALAAGLLLSWGYGQYRRTRTLTVAETDRIVLREVARNAPVNPCWVTFEYDFSALSLDSLELYWGGVIREEEGRQILREPKGRLSLGFYKGGLKLLLLRHRGQTLKRLPVLVPSGDWNCFVGGPTWTHPDFVRTHLVNENCLFIDPNVSIIDPQIRSYFMTHHYLTKRFGIGLDSVTIECRLQNKPDAFGISCYDTRLHLHDDQAQQFVVEFQRPGCREFATRPGETLRAVTTDDRPLVELVFPRILDRFYLLKVVLNNGVATTYLDNRLLSRNPYRHRFGALGGVQFKFKGSGKVDFVRLSHSRTGRVIYNNDFGGRAVD